MSTRCHIVIKKQDSYTVYVYHHCDGYPSGVGSDLAQMLKDYKSNDWTPISLANYIENTDSSYRIDDSIHGDEDYIYEINCDLMTLKCYYADDYDEESENEDSIEIPGNIDFSIYNTSPQPISQTSTSVYFDTLVKTTCAILSNPSTDILNEQFILDKALSITDKLFDNLNK